MILTRSRESKGRAWKNRETAKAVALTVSLFLYVGIFWVLFAQKIKILNSLRTLTLLHLLLLNINLSVVPSGHSRDSCSFFISPSQALV